ncbi:MAG: branched-chain amino acid ABC transporter permease [Candidatus Schekmanbacteria bacterium]|nr:branched-chain amino acid ABC transporter permease [Candidatus Schekmanbacteria bacterium]
MGTQRRHAPTVVAASLLVLSAALPALAGSASMRETMFSVLLAIGLAASLNILLGYCGYASFGHVVFFGIGGYAGFYLVAVQGAHLATAIAGGGLVAGAFAAGLGAAILRLRGPHFALATIGVNEAVKALIVNIEPLGGPTGMNLNVSVFRAYGGAAGMLWAAYGTAAAIAVGAVVLGGLVRTSRFGLGLLVIREDEDAAAVLGVVAWRYKVGAYVLSAVFPGMLGALFFFKQGVIEPAGAFRLDLSVELLVMVMLGGAGTVLGPLVGAGSYQLLRSGLLTSDLEVLGVRIRDVQLAVAGALLLLVVQLVPAGLVGWARGRWLALRSRPA